MRSQIMVISRDAALRARLAQLLTRSGYRAEVAESAAQAHRTGLDRIALAILATDGVGGEPHGRRRGVACCGGSRPDCGAARRSGRSKL